MKKKSSKTFQEEVQILQKACTKAMQLYEQIEDPALKQQHAAQLANYEGLLVVLSEGKEKQLDDDMGCVESAFLNGIQSWCNRIRHSIDEFEKDLSSDPSFGAATSFAFLAFRKIISSLAGKYKLITTIGIKLFETIVESLSTQKDKEDNITLRSIAKTWDDKIKSFQQDIGEHRKMYQAFLKKRTKSSEEALLDEIAYWPQGGKGGLPTEDDVQRSMTELWIRNLKNSSFLDGDRGALSAGYIYLEVDYSLELLKENNLSGAILEKGYIDDLFNENALKLFKKLWKGKGIFDLPLDIELYVKVRGEDGNHGFVIGQRINNSWKLIDYNYDTKETGKNILASMISDVAFKEVYKVEDLTLN